MSTLSPLTPRVISSGFSPEVSRTAGLSRIRVLLYHRILPSGVRLPKVSHAVTVEEFRRQLALLERWGFTAITLQDAHLIASGGLRAPRKPIIITLDDGCLDTYEHAFPVLQEYGMRAVVFVVADPKLHRNEWDEHLGLPGSALMRPEQIVEMHEAGFEIGSHSMDHPRLPEIPYRSAWEQISWSRMALESLLNAPVVSFAYPFGLLNLTLKECVADAGYRFGCSVWSGPLSFGDDWYEIRRIVIRKGLTLPGFMSKVLGPYRSYRKVIAAGRLALGTKAIAPDITQRRLLILTPGMRKVRDCNELVTDSTSAPRDLWRSIERSDILTGCGIASVFQRDLKKFGLILKSFCKVGKAFLRQHSWDALLFFPEHARFVAVTSKLLRGTKKPRLLVLQSLPGRSIPKFLRVAAKHSCRVFTFRASDASRVIAEAGVEPSKVVTLSGWVDEVFWQPAELVGREVLFLTEPPGDAGSFCAGLEAHEIPFSVCSLPEAGAIHDVDLYGRLSAARIVVVVAEPDLPVEARLIVLKALAMEKPVVMSRMVADSVLGDYTGIGIMTDGSSVPEIQEAVLKLWAAPDSVRTLGANARRYVQAVAALGVVATKIRSVFEDCLSSSV